MLPLINDEHEVGDNLSNPLLNPLLNPTLGKNLGRWAEAYYSTPPEKREQAILELLHELDSAQKLQSELNPPVAMEKRNQEENESQKETLICPACQHETALRQRFCGLCGVALTTSDNSDPARQLTAFAPQSLPSPSERTAHDWAWLPAKNLAEPGAAEQKSHLWKYTAFVIITFTAISVYWLWSLHSQTAIPQGVHHVEMDTPAISKQVTTQPRSDTASGEQRTIKKASVQSASVTSKWPKPAAGKPFGCKEDHLRNCSVAELHNRAMTLANTIDAIFIDYNRRVSRFRMDAKSHENDSLRQKQERLRQGNYSAQLLESVRLRSYVSNQKKDALRYRTELQRRAGARRSENSKIVDAYKNPRLCLELHYVAEDLRRLAAKLNRSEVPTSVATNGSDYR